MDGSSPTEFSELLTLSTNEIGAIEEQQDSIIVHYGNGLIKFPSKVTFNDVTWTLNCYCSPNVLGALREWRTQVYNPVTERMGLPSEYLRSVYFIRYDGTGVARDVLRAPGCWPASINYGNYDQQGGSLVNVQVTLCISKIFYMTEAEISQ